MFLKKFVKSIGQQIEQFDPSWKERILFKAQHIDAQDQLVLDIGCGAMYINSYIRGNCSSSLHQLKTDIVADLNQLLPIENESADHIISFEVLKHLAEPQVMLSEVFRILRLKDGLTLSLLFQWWIYEEASNDQCLTHSGLECQQKKSDFNDIIYSQLLDTGAHGF